MKKTSSSGSGCILLVDDEQVIRDLGREILNALGYDTVLAANGVEAVEIYGKRHHEIDMVILDMVMPEMAGRKTIDELRNIRKDVKILISSGFAFNTDIEDLIDKGLVQDFLQKPFAMQELSRKVAGVLRDKEGGKKE